MDPEQDPFKESMKADLATQPPGGRFDQDLAGSDGPPMLRMFITQLIFMAVSKNRKVGTRGKLGIVVLVSVAFLVKDLQLFLQSKSPNIY